MISFAEWGTLQKLVTCAVTCAGAHLRFIDLPIQHGFRIFKDVATFNFARQQPERAK